MMQNSAALWRSSDVDIITGGKSSAPWVAYGLCLKEHAVQPGDLFFASLGDNLDFVFECNAAAVVVPSSMFVPDHIVENYPVMRVPCVFEALRSLARAARFRTHSLVVSVQGFEQRCSFVRALEFAADVYEGDRHLSSSVAAMPDDCDFSVFGMYPSLRPDVVIVDKCSQTKDHGVIETMPDNGILLVNNDDPAALNVVSRARAAGLRNVFTYGQKEGSDALMVDKVAASDGVQIECSILGESVFMQTASDMCHHMPMLQQSPNMLLAALIVAKLSDVKLSHVANEMAASYMSPFSEVETAGDQTLKLFTPPVVEGSILNEAIFRVKNLIDVGNGARTLVLDQGAPVAKETDFNLPSKVAGLDVVCASKKISVFKNARQAAERLFKASPLSDIVPEVLSPGDYVVFKSTECRTNSVFSSALRVG